MKRKHLVWDWNGTLLDDAEVILAATNEIFAPHGTTLTMEEYQKNFRRPLTTFYGTVLGRDVSETEFLEFDAAFHSAYSQRIQECTLTHDAKEALEIWHQQGYRQSLLSLWAHHELVPLVTSLGLDTKFVRIDGRRTMALEGKTSPLNEHLAQLALNPAEVVLIGDSLDDAAAARANGARCVLYGSTHAHKGLQAAKVPVARSLTEAVEIALQ